MSLPTNPIVSVIMTVYNREMYISTAIESVLATLNVDYELIIIDDASTDASVAIARKFENQYCNIIVYENEKNLGDYGNRNRGASYAKGKYITYLDSDDYYMPNGLEYIVSEMETHPDADWGILDEDSERDERILLSQKAIEEHFFVRPFLKQGPGGTILKRTFFESLGGYPIKYGPANDMYFDLKAAAAGITLILEKRFFYYRCHAGQEINNTYGYLAAGFMYQRDAFNEIDMHLTPKKLYWLQLKNKRRFVVNIVKFYAKTFDFKKTLQALRKANFTWQNAYDGIFH